MVKYLDKLIQTFQDYVKEEREITAQKYAESKDERDRSYEVQKETAESLEKLANTQLLILEKLGVEKKENV